MLSLRPSALCHKPALFNSISVISGRYLGNSEMLCVQWNLVYGRKDHVRPQAGLETGTGRSVVPTLNQLSYRGSWRRRKSNTRVSLLQARQTKNTYI